ncbi:MAG TPA: peroxiredoxin [Burkholderiaceae bacterium]|nr:peroxiredoxin [Burkholderiaceae bacterium]
MSTVKVNEPVPAFTATSTRGEITADTLRGQYTVLFFYPRNNTPGCTNESKDFRDQHDAFSAANCRVIGISRDTLASHTKVTEKLELPYPLIADPDETICELFDVMKMKNMYGRQVRGIERSTFLIGPDGILLREWRKVRVPGHVAEVLETVQNQASQE